MDTEVVTENLLAIVAAYRSATGKTEEKVSVEFYGRSDFLRDLRAGKRSISVQQLDVVLKKFRRRWPRDAQWPFVRPVWMTRKPMV